MIARLVLTGHRRLLAAHLLALSLMGAVLGGMLGTLVRARDAAAALRSAPLMTTHLLSRISQLGGLINFTTMVVVIAGVVALMLSGTIASFTVEGFAAASRSLRLLGAPRRRVRAGLVAGVLLTMYDYRTNLSQQVVEEVRKYFPDKVYDTVIPRTVRLSEAPSYGMPAVFYDEKAKGAEVYMTLAKEVAKRG